MRYAEKWPKKCGCGREYVESTWTELPSLGVSWLDRMYEWRDCPCRSTLMAEVRLPTATEVRRVENDGGLVIHCVAK